MSRTLSRPMFRLGGSTSGITSGLDSPRVGYKTGGIDYDKAYETSQRITDKYYPKQGANLNRFLINWGLNMVGNPPSGNVLQTAAKQAQQPADELFASMDRGSAMRSATGADIFGKVISAEGEMLGSEAQGKIYKDKLMLDTLIDATKTKVRLTKALEEETDAAKIAEMEEGLLVATTTINQLRKRNPLVDKILGSTAVVKELLDVILPSYDKSMIEDPDNPGTQVLKYPKTPEGQAQKIQDAMAEIMRIVQAGGAEAQATGGRVGYQGGELVEDINVQETIQPEGMPGQQPIQPGGTPEVDAVGMSFDELRARLPETITDDIVILLSQSAQALEDFATIQTQQDVDNFNTKYNVNLVLPAEA
jgi:hypothetical protein